MRHVQFQPLRGRHRYVGGKNIILIERAFRIEPKAIEDIIGAVLPNVDVLVVWSTILAVIVRKLTASVASISVSRRACRAWVGQKPCSPRWQHDGCDV